MSSDSDNMVDNSLSSDEEGMMVESDEDLLNEETPVSETKTVPAKKHKRSYDPRYAVPTFEERQMMRDADMDVELSMLELEVQQYVDQLNEEHPCSEKVTTFLKSINEFISKLPEEDITSSSSSVYLRHVGTNKETKLRFIKPTAIYIIGSFIQKNRTPFPLTIDMTLIMPDRCFNERDLINWKYFNKRSLYLQHIAESLRKQFPKLSIKYQWMHGDYDKPALLLTLPKNVCKCGTTLRLIPVPSEKAFPTGKLTLSRNNVHVDSETQPSTWYYNSSILEDMLMNHYTQFILQQAHALPNLIPASNLLRKWLTTAAVDSHVNGFMMTILLAVLAQQGRVTASMSPWQMVVVLLDYLGKLDVTQPIHFHSTSSFSSTTPLDNTPVFQLLDDSFGYLLSYRISEEAMREVVMRAARQSEGIRGHYDPGLIQELFGTPMEPAIAYDIVLRLKVADLEKEKMFSSTNEELNYPPYVAAQRDVENWSLQGLSKRAIMVRTQYINEDNNTWTLKEAYTHPEYLLLFITLNPDNISRLADRGPQAKSPEVAAWQQLWGSKSELRRYKDGSIQYTNLWTCKPGQNYMVPAEIVRYVLSLHAMCIVELKVLSQPLAEVIPQVGDAALTEITNKLCSVIRDEINEYERTSGLDLGGHITTVEPISYDVNGCSLMSASPSPYLNSDLPTSGHTHYTVVKPIELAVRIQGASGLPSDVTVLDDVKTIWATTISTRLEKLGYECHATRCALDVYHEGYCFRLLPYTDREVDMAGKMLRSHSLKEEDYQYRFTHFEFLPPHQTVLKNAMLQNPAFLPAIRLFKLWASAHMFSQVIPEALMDELVLAVFSKNPAPLHPVEAFLRVLRLIVTFPWSEATLAINSNGVLTAVQLQEMVKEVDEARREATQKVVCSVVSPLDKHSVLTRLIQPAVWSRLIAVAQNTLKQVLKGWLDLSEPHALFVPALQDFDLVLNLRPEYLSPIPKWMRVFGKAGRRGASYICKEFKNVMMNRNKLLVDYRPEEVLLNAVREAVGSGGVVMMNSAWGKKIGIAWKPGYFVPSAMSMASVSHCFPVQKGEGKQREDVMLVRDIFDMLHCLKENLGDVLEDIEFK